MKLNLSTKYVLCINYLNRYKFLTVDCLLKYLSYLHFSNNFLTIILLIMYFR